MALRAAETNGTSQDTEALYREHGVAVAAFCRSLLRDRGETEDATQQVFLSAHRALLNGAVPREPRAWLLAVARNECYARFRQHAVAPVPAGDAPEESTADASVHVLRAGELANLWDEVRRMPPTQREAFLLREIRGLSYGQLADELSLSRPSVRSLLLRARTRLRRRLGDVAAGLGGAQWVQALLRLAAGGDTASPVPAATKAAVVGIGALALAGGGGLVARHASTPPRHAAAHHPVAAPVHRIAVPAAVAVVRREVRSSRVEHSRGRDDSARTSGSGRVGSHERSGERGRRSSGEGSAGRGHDGSDDLAVAAQPTSDGPGSGGSSGDGSSSDSGRDSSGGGSGTSGSSSGSDGGSGSGSGSSDSGSGSNESGGSGSDGGGGRGG